MAGMYGCFKRNSESSAMASGPPDVMANQEAAEAAEECSGKKKSKFQTFKKFFARKKRKEPSASGADAALKGSQSTDNISKTSENNTLTHSEKEKGSGSKISLGSKALSHDSVFVSDSSEANEALGASQDSIHGKVKSLQLQLKQAIRLGSPPSLMCVKRTEDMGTMSEDDGLPCSPPEYAAHTALAQVQGNSSISLDGTDSDEDQLSCAASSRAVSPLVVVPGDFSQPASPFACLDNSAAKHKLGLRHKACNKRKPATRLELRAEGDSAVEDILNSSISEAVEENNEQKVKDASADEFKPEEEEEEEEEEEKEQAEHSRQFLLSDKEEREESSSEPEAEQDVSDGPGTSCPPETGLSEEEATDAQPSASSETGSGASSLDSPRGTPEPPAGQREYLMDPPGTTYGTEEEEKRDQSDSVLGLTGGEDGEQETEEEEGESSFLQEVLSSLKTPLNSPLVETESIVLELEQEEVKNREEEKEEEEEEEKKAETEEGEGVEAEDEDEDEDVEEPVIYQAVVSGSSISDQNTKGEEEEVTTTTASYNEAKEEMKHVEEEEEDDSTEKEEEEEEEEELIVEHFSQYDQVEEVQKEDVEKTEEEEENSLHVTQTDNQMEEKEEKKMEEEEEEEEGEEEEEAKELEQEHEAKGEKLEETVEHNKEDDVEVEEKNEEVEEPEEAKEDEEEDAEEKMLSDADGGKMVVDPEETVDDINTVNKDETEYETDGDKILPGQEEDVFDMFHESQKAFDQMEPTEQNLDQEDAAASEPNVEESRSQQDEEQETKQEKEQSNMDTTVSSRPSSLILPQTPTTPSKTSTIHINLVSPSAEKFASCFPLPPSTVEAKKSMSTVEEPGDKEEKAEEEEATQHSDAATASNKEAKLSAPVDETSKVRFTITPAWQRLLSTGEKDSPILHSSPPASIFSSSATGGTEVVTMEEPLEKAESVSSAKAEVMLSPSRAKNAEMTTPKPQWNTSPTPESSVVLEGNSNNPFGVRLRKTSALHCFSSEEENAEPVHESAPQLSSCTADSLQPLSIKPSGSQPISNKPALPKKPEVTGDGGGKAKRILDPTAARSGSDPPSWISVAKQKQKVYKENPLDNTAVQKEEQERKSSLPMSSSSNKTPESSSKVSLLELNKSSAPVEKESRRSLSPPTPVPPQPAKSLSLPFPVPPKPNVTTSTTPKPSPQRSLSPPTPVPVGQRPPSCMSPLSTSKPAPSLPTGNMTLTSPPFSSRTTPAQSAGSSPTPAAQRGVPSPALSQDEPPWMALAKKKAKAWSEMPQIVQ